jgi:hypothetical protein
MIDTTMDVPRDQLMADLRAGIAAVAELLLGVLVSRR